MFQKISMEIIPASAQMKQWSRRCKAQGKSIGLVPTMGYLHEGHLSLIRRCRAATDSVVVSIFVNPTQFGPGEDLDRYPRDEEGDLRKCRELGTDAVFMPDASQIYGPNHQTYVEVGPVAEPLCGATRPGHFRGVATVVLKLFNIVLPDRAYFGSKDYQQLQVIKTMVRDFDLDVDVVACQTVREQDGLAMSSRNAYLSPEERNEALCLYKALTRARALFAAGETNGDNYLKAMREIISREPNAEIDYVSLVDPESLQDLEKVDSRALAALAVRVGRTRLIDNMLLE